MSGAGNVYLPSVNYFLQLLVRRLTYQPRERDSRYSDVCGGPLLLSNTIWGFKSDEFGDELDSFVMQHPRVQLF
jgi:hypothetical protein